MSVSDVPVPLFRSWTLTVVDADDRDIVEASRSFALIDYLPFGSYHDRPAP
jgi:hypothetical protein